MANYFKKFMMMIKKSVQGLTLFPPQCRQKVPKDSNPEKIEKKKMKNDTQSSDCLFD